MSATTSRTQFDRSAGELDKAFAVGVGKRMRQVREQASRTLEEAAEAVGFSVSSVSAWERGRRQPSLRAMAGLARFYGSTVGTFFPSPEEGWAAPVEAGSERLARVERQVKTMRKDLYDLLDELRREGLIAQP